MKNKKKVTTAVVAVATAAALVLGGTFAWQSINQTALNEAEAVVNPGGRLHDDFYIDANGDYNSDIYVENFATENIYARIQLREFMELYVNYGTNAETLISVAGNRTGDEATPDNPKAPYSYDIHYFDQENSTDKYWNWSYGDMSSSPAYYMPTFNMNKDSLVADRNGMYVDRIGGISNRGQEQYEDYTIWEDGDVDTQNEIHDYDSNLVDEVGYDFNNLSTYEADGNIALKSAEHIASLIGDSNGLISMTEWLEKLNDGEDTADYWVYDTDGWVYWSSPIAAGSTTGRLLDSIELKQVMDDTWYYAIDVIAQFVTADSVGKSTGTGFYTDGYSVPSSDAEILLDAIGVDMNGEVNDDGNDDDDYEDYYDSAITVNNQGPNEAGEIYLYGLDIEKNNSFDVRVSNDYELVENGLTATFHEDGILDTTLTVDEDDPYSGTLTIASRDYHAVTITAAFTDGSSESVKVIPIYNTIIITPDMNGATLTLPSGYYTLESEDFDGAVTFELTGSKRSNLYSNEGKTNLSVSSYESSTDITLTTTDGAQTADVKIVVVEANPYDGPMYTYYIQGQGVTWSYALMETQEYCWEQNDDYTYQVNLSMTNDFAGAVEWSIDGAVEEGQSVYFVDENGSKAVTFEGMEPNIKFTAQQNKPFKLMARIYVDAEKTEVMSGFVWDEEITFDESTQYFVIIPSLKGYPVLHSLHVNQVDGENYHFTSLAAGESAEVEFFSHNRYGDDRDVTNADVTWALVDNTGNCSFEITEGDSEGNTAVVTHTCSSENCDKTGAVLVQVSYDYAYGMSKTSEFYIISADYAGDLEFEDEGDEGDDSQSTLAMTFSSDPEYSERDGGAYIEITRNREEELVWNLYGCSEEYFTLSSSDARVIFEPYGDDESNQNFDMNIIIPIEVTEDFTVTATSMDGTKSVTFTIEMSDN